MLAAYRPFEVRQLNALHKKTDGCRLNATPAVGILIRVIMSLTIAFNYRSLYDTNDALWTVLSRVMSAASSSDLRSTSVSNARQQYTQNCEIFRKYSINIARDRS